MNGKRPSVLHLTTRYTLGGSERRIRDAILAIDADHHVVIGREAELDIARNALSPATISQENSLIRQPSPPHDVAALQALRKRLRTGRYDLVFTNTSKAGALGRLAVRLEGGPPVIHSLSMANFGPGYGRGSDAVFRGLERSLVETTSAYAVVGEDLARRYARHVGAPIEKMTIIRSGAPTVGPELHKPARSYLCDRYELDPDRPILGYVGSLDERKNAHRFADFLGMVGREFERRPQLLIVGAGPLGDSMMTDFTRQGLQDDVRMLGHVSGAEELIAGFDLFVLLSRAEGLPQVLLQSAVAGTPFVSTDVDGAMELIRRGARGRIVAQNDIAGAANTAVTALRSTAERRPIDPSEWNPAVIADRYRALFDKVLGGVTSHV